MFNHWMLKQILCAVFIPVVKKGDQNKLQRCEWSLDYHQYGISFGNVVWYRSDLYIILCAIYYCGYILLNVELNYTQLNIFSMCRRKRVKGN